MDETLFDMDAYRSDWALTVAKRIADAIGLEESATHREVWDHLCYNVLNGPACWPVPERGSVHINAHGVHLCLKRYLDGAIFTHRVERVLSRPDPRDRAWFARADAALDGLLTAGLVRAKDAETLAWLTA